MPRSASSPNSAPRAAPKKLLGRTQPRIWTPPLRPLNRKTSRGYEVADFAEMIGEPLLPWQRWAVIHAMELNPDGTYRFRTVLILVARQNGKSSLKRIVSLWRLYMDGARLILGCAQDVSQAREQWNYTLDTIRAHPDLAAELDTVRNVNGDEWFRVTSGGRYKIAASNDKAGRGLSVDELNIDELRTQTDWKAWSALSKTTMARKHSQIWAMSNAGSDDSVVLNQLREAATTGREPSLGILEWSAEENCELDNWDQICQANPGLGYTIDPGAIRTALATDPPAVYRTEVLCQRVEQMDYAVDPDAWKACADPNGTLDGLRDRVACVFDAAPDGQHFTLAAAARSTDGRPRIELIRAWTTTESVRLELPGLLEKVKPRALWWYPSGPAAELGTVLRTLTLRHNFRPGKRQEGDGPEDGEIKGIKVSEICQEFAGLVRSRSVVHSDEPLLNDHIRGTSKFYTGDGWRFMRKGAGHCDAAYAAAGATYAALTMPEPKRAQIRILG